MCPTTRSRALAYPQVPLAQQAHLLAGVTLGHHAGDEVLVLLGVFGAGLGIGKGAAAAAEGISRQPAAAAQITGTVNLPIFLLEGVAILAEVFVLIVVVLK